MDKEKMFCFQCQETARGSGCTVQGVCGKKAHTSARMDLLVAVVRSVGVAAEIVGAYGDVERDGEDMGNVGRFVTDALFATITNANFDDDSLTVRIKRGIALRDALVAEARKRRLAVPDYAEFKLRCDGENCLAQAEQFGVLRYDNEDVRSLKELTMYGLKGISAYYEHALRLGFADERIVAFVCHALAVVSNDDVATEELTALVFDTGKTGVDVMQLLDRANTSVFGNPEVTHVNIGAGSRPGILVSGHDLLDIEDLLLQTEGTGIDIYTHSEMLPAHYYPRLKRFAHLRGNYGNAWWRQREELEHFHGPVIFTTNCIVPPLPGAGYSARAFTLNSAGYPGWRHIPTGADGHKDFSEVTELARTCQPPDELEHGEITGGFAHAQVLALADKITEAVRSGKIRRFVVMSGCDGRMAARDYYTLFAKALPADTVILTSGCAKYRYIKLPLGDIGGIPRVLDAGQCNDSYSWVVVAMKLKEIFDAADVNSLPISFNIAWYEQKAVIVLLALLSLGFKNIHVGPTLPAFLSPKVKDLLVTKFGLGGITTVEEDIVRMV